MGPMRFGLFFALLLSACASDPVCPPPTPQLTSAVSGAEHEPPVPTPTAHEGLNARLSGFDYPFEVQAIELSMQGQPVEMVYMDVRPAGEVKGTVLLLHGKNFSGAYWERTIRVLVEAGYRAIAPDQIGFGKSSKPTDVTYSFHEMTRHTLALLDHLRVEKALVIGHSMGGMLATRFALTAPARTTGLVLMNPIGLEDWQRVVPYASIEETARAEAGREPGAVKAYMLESYFAGQWDEAYDPLLAIQVGWLRGPDRERMALVSALTYEMIFTQPVLHEFPDLAMPTLLIIGQRDRTAVGKGRVSAEVRATLGDYPALGRAAAAAIPDAELVELDDVGHVPQFEAFDRTMPPLLEFIGARYAD
tara:strand:+ start:503 stop:1588 length:1086 start_codon:yes stop_codon:yes gene_type:complete